MVSDKLDFDFCLELFDTYSGKDYFFIVKPLIYFLWGFHIHTGYDMPDISSFLVAFHFCHNRVNKRVNVFGLMKPYGTHGFPDASS